MSERSPLLEAYLNGELDAEGFAAFNAWLREDPAHLRQWVVLSFMAQELGDALAEQSSSATQLIVTDKVTAAKQGVMDAEVLALLQQIEASSHDAPLVDIADSLKAKPRHKRQGSSDDVDLATAVRELSWAAGKLGQKLLVSKPVMLAAAAIVLLATVVFMDRGGNDPQDLADNTAEPNRPAESAQPILRDTPGTQTVATLTATHNATWAEGASAPGSPLPIGTALAPGQRLTLTQGFAEITTRRGAVAILEAPASLELLDNDNALKLHSGKFVVICETESSQGFVVKTDNATITDYGTEFGVQVGNDGSVFAQTFTGLIGIKSNRASSELMLSEGDSAIADSSSQVRRIKSRAYTFVRPVEFEAICHADESPRDQWIAQRYQLLRKPDVAAFMPFTESLIGWPKGIGYQQIRVGRDTQATSFRPADHRDFGAGIHWQGRSGIGDALVANGSDSIFIDLDVAEGGAFDEAGLVNTDGQVGRPGTTLYLAWTMQGDASKLSKHEYAGLSLMIGDRRARDELLFVGKTQHSSDWAVVGWAGKAEAQPQINRYQPLLIAGKPKPVDSESHLWLVKIDFARGPDRVEFYLDPDLRLPELPEPNLTLTHIDIAFDRLRFETGSGAKAWRIDDLYMTTTRPGEWLNGVIPD